MIAGKTLAKSLAATWSIGGHAGCPVPVVPISVDPFTIGRSMSSSLCLADSTVSGRHAQLVAAADSFLLQDLGSTNGTFLNGNRLTAPGGAVVTDGDVLQLGAVVLKLIRGHQTQLGMTVAQDCAEEALALVAFTRLFSENALVPYFQPIVEIETQTVRGYELLSRSRIAGLQNPFAMFRAAAQHNAESRLSRLMREAGVRAATSLATAPVYFNTHPAELGRPDLIESLAAVRREFPQRPMVLEVHEAAVTSLHDLQELQAALRDLQIGLAFDDFGAGQARLLELATIRPDVVKFDVALIRNLDQSPPHRRRMLEALVGIVHDMQIIPLAEGIETEAEAAMCRYMGFQLAQGFRFGRPAPAETWMPPSERTRTPHQALFEKLP